MFFFLLSESQLLEGRCGDGLALGLYAVAAMKDMQKKQQLMHYTNLDPSYLNKYELN